MALGTVLGKNTDNKVELWDKDTLKVEGQRQLSEVVSDAEFVFLCVPSWVNREVASEIAPHLRVSTIVVSLSKGIEKETLETMDFVLHETLPTGHQFALCLGPMMAEEISKDMFTVGVIATPSKSIFEKINSLFENSNLKFEHTEDVKGAALASILKSVYAIGVGLLDGFKLEDNAKGWFVTKALSEISEIIELLGGKKETAYDLAGVGDLVSTGFSTHSRNRKVGYKIASGELCSKDSEGAISLQYIVKLLKGNLEKLPLLNAIDKIINEDQDPKLILGK